MGSGRDHLRNHLAQEEARLAALEREYQAACTLVARLREQLGTTAAKPSGGMGAEPVTSTPGEQTAVDA